MDKVREKIKSVSKEFSHMAVVFTGPASTQAMMNAEDPDVAVELLGDAPIRSFYLGDNVSHTIIDTFVENYGNDNMIVIANNPEEKGDWVNTAQGHGVDVYGNEEYKKMSANWNCALK